MAQQHAIQPTLIGTLWPAEAVRPLRWAVLAVVGTGLLTLSAKIQVPFYPVPQTMQTFVVLGLAMAYGALCPVPTIVPPSTEL